MTKRYDIIEYKRIPTRTITASASVLVGDEFIVADCSSNDVTLTLPAIAQFDGREFRVKKIGPAIYTLTIATNGTEVIDDEDSWQVRFPYQAYSIIAENGKWWVV